MVTGILRDEGNSYETGLGEELGGRRKPGRNPDSFLYPAITGATGRQALSWLAKGCRLSVTKFDHAANILIKGRNVLDSQTGGGRHEKSSATSSQCNACLLPAPPLSGAASGPPPGGLLGAHAGLPDLVSPGDKPCLTGKTLTRTSETCNIGHSRKFPSQGELNANHVYHTPGLTSRFGVAVILGVAGHFLRTAPASSVFPSWIL
jgi:hypothetical protein